MIPYAVIYADKITDEIQKIMESFSRQETPITALQNEEISSFCSRKSTW